ncbi:MAG: DUF3300 domain-containing protein [Candidatus Sulfotelmatobacter sp.]|jgi:uncharacterized protein DUF3300
MTLQTQTRASRTSSTLLFVLALVFLLLPLGKAELFAQQAPDDGQYTQNQQSPNQQPGYGQPGYPQPQPEGQQPYPQPSYPQQSYPAPGQMNPQQGSAAMQPLSAQELQQLVAPIALYPDSLVAQVLTAATYPAQVADADRWRRTQGYASSDQIAAGADAQPWDPSVKALTAFPQVLAQMNYNLQWATELGNAYYNQPQDVLEAVQVMRQRAQAAGNLRSSPQEMVNYDQGNIVLAPVNPEVVYVPVYNPWAVYGQPVAPYPGFSLLGALGSFIGSSVGPLAVRFGLGIATTAFMHTPFGLLAWGLDWLAHSVLFHGSNYYSHSSTVADWGFPHGGPRAFSRGGWSVARSNNLYRTPSSYGRSGVGYTARSQAFARTPDRYAYRANRPTETYNRGGYQTAGGGYGRSSAQAYNSVRPAISQQQYGRSSYGSSAYSYGKSTESYRGGRGVTYGGSTRASRAPSANFRRSNFGKQSSGKSSRSGGFHLFGGGHGAKSFNGGKSFGHGHSGGGSHGGHSGGKHHR